MGSLSLRHFISHTPYSHPKACSVSTDCRDKARPPTTLKDPKRRVVFRRPLRCFMGPVYPHLFPSDPI